MNRNQLISHSPSFSCSFNGFLCVALGACRPFVVDHIQLRHSKSFYRDTVYYYQHLLSTKACVNIPIYIGPGLTSSLRGSESKHAAPCLLSGVWGFCLCDCESQKKCEKLLSERDKQRAPGPPGPGVLNDLRLWCSSGGCQG